MNVLQRIFGTKTQRDLKRLQPLVKRINEIEAQYQQLSEEALRAKTTEFRDRLKQGESLDDLLCEAFAAVKNACRRLRGTPRDVCGHELVWDMVPFDVQLLGGIVLHQGKIAEMQTGEGKTLVATLPLYLNALNGNNVHLVTVNDYLALRDSQWMGAVFEYLGLTVGCIQNHMSPVERREQYGCDITYGTNSEFGFDYLRDNGMAVDPEQLVQRGYHYAIVDEVDSILIDEARTPLIISGPAATSSHQYDTLKPRIERLVQRQRDLCNGLVHEIKAAMEENDNDRTMRKLYQVYHGMPKHKQLLHLLENPAVRKLHEQVESMMLTEMRKEEGRELLEQLLFTIDERSREVSLTDRGCELLNPDDPEMFVLPDLVGAMSALEGDKNLTETDRAERRREIQADFMTRSERVQNVDQLLRAYCLYERDVEYVVQENHVMIVDEFTGRIMPGRRWSDGLHQAIEAKEGVQIERETQTLATITIQNYFRMYSKLAGMTGTAETEASEFNDIYKLDVVPIPTNRPVRRVDENDLIFKTQREKYKAVIDEVKTRHDHGQPVLLGTVNVDTSEILSRMLRMAHIPHNVLNAKNHAREAEIVSLAGQPGAVTIATNMAGRGTDIKLGPGVVWLDDQTIKSRQSLDDRQKDGKTLRQLLLERPCGLHVIGSERHESRRIDRQLRGRCARQGDPGSSRFYISLEDDLMRLFGSERISGIMSRLGMQEGEALEHRWLNRSVETAQRRVEQQNFAIRKRTLEYDDVMNKQREVVYAFRGQIVRSDGREVRDHILDIVNDLIRMQCDNLMASPKDSRPAELVEWIQLSFPIAVGEEDLKPLAGQPEEAGNLLYSRVAEAYELKCGLEDSQVLPIMERQVVLHAIDTQWQEYLRSMDELRHDVGLRAYGQRDPLVEYKREAFGMFEELMGNIKSEIAQAVFRASTSLENLRRLMRTGPGSGRQQLVHSEVNMLGPRQSVAPRQGAGDTAGQTGARQHDFDQAVAELMPEEALHHPHTREVPKVGRNDPCPCGSGKKFKKCCGKNA